MAVSDTFPKPDPLLSSLSVDLILMARSVCGRDWGDHGTRIHDDPFSRLYWVISGEGEATYVKSGKRQRIGRGQMHLMPAFSPIKLRCEDSIDFFWCHFNAKIFSGLDFFEAFPCETAANVDKRGHESVDRLWEEMNEGFWLNKFHSRVAAEGILRRLLAWQFKSIDEPEKRKSCATYDKLRPALDFIDHNFRRQIGLGELAGLMNIQPHYLSNLFSELMGDPPMRYINKRRVKEAQRLLRFSELSLKEIAAACGFSNEFYFSKTFRLFAGCPPKTFRAEGRLEAKYPGLDVPARQAR